MSQQDAFAEAVLFFDGNDVSVEMHYSEFETLLNQGATLEACAGRNARGCYVVIGTGLAIRGAVCFQLKFDQRGHADREFSVPLRHLVRLAGPGADIGAGTIRLASRSQCSVSWHAMNLWEPEGEGEANPLKVAQRAIWRNRLGVKLKGQTEPLLVSDTGPIGAIVQERAERKIAEAFGQDGRVSLQQLIRNHNDQIDALTKKYRTDLEQQQQIYLDQIRGCRDEMQKLKVMLRQEQERSRRLQQLLRGEIGQ
jgi:hypothetical protein